VSQVIETRPPLKRSTLLRGSELLNSVIVVLPCCFMYGPSMISIRPMRAEDIQPSRKLLSELGYPLSREELRRRYDSVMEAAGHTLLVADDDGHIIALCHVYARPALDKPPEAVVQALVVDQACRGRGVGRDMMVAAEAWASDHGFTSVALYSNTVRADAHAFYRTIGYQDMATSQLFRKSLD
jgi:GNAT superfamily N-acetyltransferase